MNNPEDRFFARIEQIPFHSCWEWTGAKSNGYGKMMIRRKYVSAHRFSYMIHKGPIGAGMFVCHRCDNPGCVNPEHLFLGTLLDNHADMMEKGRHRAPSNAGEGNPRARLTRPKVVDVLHRIAEGETHRRIAAVHGVSASTIGMIACGKNWRAS